MIQTVINFKHKKLIDFKFEQSSHTPSCGTSSPCSPASTCSVPNQSNQVKDFNNEICIDILLHLLITDFVFEWCTLEIEIV